MRSDKQGSALIVVVTLSTLLLLAAIASSMSAVSNIGITDEEKIKTKLEFACESALNRARAKVEESFNNGELAELEPYILFEGSESDDTGLSSDEKAFSDEEFIEASSNEPDYYAFIVQDTEEDKPIYAKYAITYNGNDPDFRNGWERGQASTIFPMKIEAIAYMPGYGWIGMQEEAHAKRSTLFMYNIFFEDELEILPGPNFNLKGLIHTNKDMYLSSNNTLSINTDSMTAAGEMFRRRMNNTESLGTVKISVENEDGSYATMEKSPREDSTNSNWINLATKRWKGSVRDKHLGATRLDPPDLGSFEPGGFYDKNSGFGLTVHAKDNNPPLYTLTINQIPVVSNATLANLNTYLNDAVKEVQFYDRRESTSKKVNVTEIDLDKLGDISGGGGNKVWADNGLFYLTRDDAVKDKDGNPYSPDPNRVVSGFKLSNGSELADAATFVTNNTMYLKGDFNIHTSEDPIADDWKPCAVIADAINVLSNSWSDSQSSSMRSASNTTYNLVFVQGNVPTNETTGQYSGGLENFPRMLESWSGKNLNINGGMMQLFRSQYSTGNWSYGNYYTAPTRSWAAEERFSDLNNFPPMFTSLFPSVNNGIIYSNWTKISQDETDLVTDEPVIIY
ncbi:MAG: hypothetical protein AB1782_03090 [Cyanobacteriota bacterium]